ncbi:MAG: hypothetical protein H0W70_00655 [Actinobacteria bacterium]|nr:hypothetical protein [Actinomycetota bacterium]
MRDIAFLPSRISVTKGETVKFLFRNTGSTDHEAFIGDAAAQEVHESDMGNADGGMHHAMKGAVTVGPGKTRSLTHRFAKAGRLLVGCHEPGHYNRGMKLTVTVT